MSEKKNAKPEIQENALLKLDEVCAEAEAELSNGKEGGENE